MLSIFTDGYGKPVFLGENELWPEADKDYTPHMNYISAVWPQLRYNSYVVAVLNARSLDVTTYYLSTTNISLPDPCSHPDAIKCGSTSKDGFAYFFRNIHPFFVNIFKKTLLITLKSLQWLMFPTGTKKVNKSIVIHFWRWNFFSQCSLNLRKKAKEFYPL